MINFTKLLCDKRGISGRLHQKSIRVLGVWNLTRRCNLSCQHCYITADTEPLRDELSTEEAKNAIDAFASISTGVLLFSGGEPLLRDDIFELLSYAHHKNLRCALSTNGALITAKTARELKGAGIIYAGVSIDGDRKTHDAFRGAQCFDKAIAGLNFCRDAGIPVGIRFTVNALNYKTLPNVFDVIVKEKIPRFCMYHLVYSGRAESTMDISTSQRRNIVEYLIQMSRQLAQEDIEILTVDNPCDGVYLYKIITEENPAKARQLLSELACAHGRCSAGERIVNISPRGDVFACQFWNCTALGNIRTEKITSFWKDTPHPLLKELRDKESRLRGKCGICHYKHYCGGCRLRAHAVYNDFWQEDPSCYLTQQEVTEGLDAAYSNPEVLCDRSS